MCSCGPITGWYRDGFCKTDLSDIGQHTICCVMNESFLSYSKAQGNDLITPKPNYDFPGLKPGDHWCLCAPRWKQAYEDGMDPLVRLNATEIGALGVVGIERLRQHSYSDKEINQAVNKRGFVNIDSEGLVDCKERLGKNL